MRPLHTRSEYNSDWDYITDHRQRISSVTADNDMEVQGINLQEKWGATVQHALVINNSSSTRARTSAQSHNLTVVDIETHDLTLMLPPEYRDQVKIRNLVIPKGHQLGPDTRSWHHQVRNMNHRLDYREISRIFDHMSAWHYIITVSRTPAVIMEANVELDRLIPYHLPRNSVIGLDTQGQLYAHNTNYRVMPGTWAYSIDQFAARRMFNRVMQQGIREPLELMFRADQQLIVLGSCAHRVV